MRKMILLPALLLLTTTAFAQFVEWEAELNSRLPLLGHRNWIVVADSAYPLQTAPGIRTIYADEEQVYVLEAVLRALDAARHVQPVIYTDAELPAVAESDAPGIGTYRRTLKQLLRNRTTEILPHEEIIARLDEAGKTFSILLIKTRMALPYTSVFFQLECGYWNAAAEQRLRQALEQKP